MEFLLYLLSQPLMSGYSVEWLDDNHDADDDGLSIASGDMFVVPRGHLYRKNRGQNSYFYDNAFVTASSTVASTRLE